MNKIKSKKVHIAIVVMALLFLTGGYFAHSFMGAYNDDANISKASAKTDAIPLLFLSLIRIANFHPFSIACEKMLDFQTIAVDFDGTLCYSKWPELGQPNQALIEYCLLYTSHLMYAMVVQ